MTAEPSLAETCAQAVMDAVPPVMRFIRAEMRRQGTPVLSVSQFRTLGFVSRHPGCSFSDVALFLGVTRATISAMIERLVAQGLVLATHDANERRRGVLRLTEAGEALRERARSATRDRLQERLADLTPAQLTMISEAVALLQVATRGEAQELG